MSAGKVEEKTFKYIGFGIQQLPSKIILNHSEYVDNIKNVTIDPKRASKNNEPLNEREQILFRQRIGQLNWAVQGSRPDMAFDMIAMSTKLKQGKVGDLVRAIKKICRLVLGWAYRGLTGGFLLLQNFCVDISVSPHVCFILVLILISMFLR